MKLQGFLFLCLLFCAFADLTAQAGPPIFIDRIENIRFDGQVDEPEWDAIEPLPLVQYEPRAG
ncbi:hypothetical protein, partial [Muriicola sp.]